MSKLKRYDPTQWFFNQLLFCAVIIAFICVMVLIFGCEKQTPPMVAEETETIGATFVDPSTGEEFKVTATVGDVNAEEFLVVITHSGWTCEEDVE